MATTIIQSENFKELSFADRIVAGHRAAELLEKTYPSDKFDIEIRIKRVLEKKSSYGRCWNDDKKVSADLPECTVGAVRKLRDGIESTTNEKCGTCPYYIPECGKRGR